MTHRKKLYMTLGIIAVIGLGATGIAAAGHDKFDDRYGAHNIAFSEDGRIDGKGRHGKRGKHLFQMLERYDTNGDDALGIEEVINARQAEFTSFDSDQSGTLSLEEFEVLWQQSMRAHMVDRFQRIDDDGDGIINVEDYNDRLGRMMSFMDRNGDGVISREDRRRD